MEDRLSLARASWIAHDPTTVEVLLLLQRRFYEWTGRWPSKEEIQRELERLRTLPPLDSR